MLNNRIFLKDVIQSINEINANENSIISLKNKYELDELEFILSELKKVDKSKLSKARRLLHASENVKKHERIPVEAKVFSFNEVMDILDKYTNEEIEKKYNLSEVKSMYVTFYENSSPSRTSKSKLIDSLRKISHGIKRAKSFNS